LYVLAHRVRDDREANPSEHEYRYKIVTRTRRP